MDCSLAAVPATCSEGGQIFALPALLPEDARVLLDPSTCLMLVLRTRQEEMVGIELVAPLAPSAFRVLLALCQAAPHPCSYGTLFAALYPAQEGEPEPPWNPAVGLRPLRRALALLLPLLPACDLQVVALRGRGYMLLSASAATFRREPSSRRDRAVSRQRGAEPGMLSGRCIPQEPWR